MKKFIQILIIQCFVLAVFAQSEVKPITNDGKMDRVEKSIESIPGVASEIIKSSTTTTKTTTTTSTTSGSPVYSSQPSSFTSVPSTTANSGNTASSARSLGGDPNKPAIYTNSRTAYNLMADDDLSGVDFIEYKINEGEYSRYTVPISLSKEGPATITYKTTDKVGNKEQAQVINLIVDNTPPNVGVKSAEPLYQAGNTVYSSARNSYQLVAEDAVSGVQQVVYSVDNEAKQEYKNQPIKFERPGFHVINFYGIDNAGNVSQENSYIVNVDNIKPTVEIKESMPYIMINNKVYAKKETVFTLTAADGQSGIKQIFVKKDAETDFVPYVEPLTFGASGEHVIEAKSIDNAGNESDIKRVIFSNDIKAPNTIIKAVSN
jgi:LysM repeat protein